MNDAALLADLKRAQYADDAIKKLRQAGIDTYSRLLALLRDEAIILHLSPRHDAEAQRR